jgi:hypothetical protein
VINGIAFAKARKQEEAFFLTTEPWRSLDPVWKKRLGTKNLIRFLSDELSSFIQRR